MADQGANDHWVGLAEALAALRDDLETAWRDGQPAEGEPVGVRFKIDPIELTIQIGVTRSTTGSAGVKWHILALGGDHARERSSTQTLSVRLTPVLVDQREVPLQKSKQYIDDSDD